MYGDIVEALIGTVVKKQIGDDADLLAANKVWNLPLKLDSKSPDEMGVARMLVLIGAVQDRAKPKLRNTFKNHPQTAQKPCNVHTASQNHTTAMHKPQHP